MVKWLLHILAIAIVACFSLLPSTVPVKAECLTLLSPFTGLEQQLIPSLQAKLAEYEICIIFKRADSEEATAKLREGKADGEFLRTSDYRSKVSGFAVMIEEPVVEGYGLLITRKDQTPSLKNLKGKAIGVKHGFVWQEKVLPANITKAFVGDYKTGLHMLQRGQISGLLIDNLNYSRLKKGFANMQTQRVTAKQNAYIFLHKRHKNLAPQIGWAISAWKKEFFEPQTN